MAAIFISYRRDDASGYAGRLGESLAARYGADEVFTDVGMEPGVEFDRRLEAAVGGCQVLLALIGDRWLDARDSRGRRRLDDPRDYLRREIEMALGAPGILVVPVLIRGARMPPEDDLPPSLAPLARRHAHRLDDEGWVDDLRRLVAVLNRVLEPADGASAPDPEEEDGRGGGRPVLVGLGVTALAVLPAWAAAKPVLDALPRLEDSEVVLRLAVFRGTFWLVLVACVAAAVAIARRSGPTPVAALLGGLVVGAAAGLLGGALDGLLRVADARTAGLVADFATIGALVGASRLVTPAGGAGALAGAITGGLAGWLVASAELGSLLVAQAVCALAIVAGLALADALAGRRPVPPRVRVPRPS